MEKEIQAIQNFIQNHQIATIEEQRILNERLKKIEHDLELKTTLIKAFQDMCTELRGIIESTSKQLQGLRNLVDKHETAKVNHESRLYELENKPVVKPHETPKFTLFDFFKRK